MELCLSAMIYIVCRGMYVKIRSFLILQNTGSTELAFYREEITRSYARLR